MKSNQALIALIVLAVVIYAFSRTPSGVEVQVPDFRLQPGRLRCQWIPDR